VRIAAVLALGLAACVAEAPEPDATTVRLGADVDAGTLDPRLMRNTTAYRVNNLLYDGLVRLGPDLAVEPGLATRWENPDPTTWIFHLREGVDFHNRTPFTADDVVFTFSTILDPALGSPSRPLLLPMEAVEAIDSLTVRVRLSEPYAPLLSYLDVGIVSRAYAEAGGDLSTSPVGTGPMKLASWSRGSTIRLVRNDEYWGGPPSVETFDFVVVADNTARAQAFEAGDLDIIQSPLSPRDIRRLEADSGHAGAVLRGLAITYLNINTRNGALADPAMRRALAMLVDQGTIVDVIYEGVDRVAQSVLLPSSWAFDAEVRQPTFDPEAASAALDALGWSDSDGDGVRDRDGAPLSIELSTHSEDPNRIQALEYLQSVFEENGVDIRVAISDWPAFFASVQGGQHEMALLGWTQIVDPDRLMFGQFTTGGGLNYGGYSNTAVDRLLLAARHATDRGERTTAYGNAARIIAEELPFYVISYQDYQVFHASHVALEPDVRGMMRGAIGL